MESIYISIVASRISFSLELRSLILRIVGQDDVLFRKLPYFEGSVCPAGEEAVVLVHQDLGDTLTDVLEDSVPRVLAGKGVVATVTAQ